jgi:hypothetical protein
MLCFRKCFYFPVEGYNFTIYNVMKVVIINLICQGSVFITGFKES